MTLAQMIDAGTDEFAGLLQILVTCLPVEDWHGNAYQASGRMFWFMWNRFA